MLEASASYQGFLIGLTLVVLAGLILSTGRISRPIGVLFGIAGVAYFVVGWILVNQASPRKAGSQARTPRNRRAPGPLAT
jgi:hypothetical protein